MTLAISFGSEAEPLPFRKLGEAIRKSVEARPTGQFIHARRDGSLLTVGFAETLRQALVLTAGLRSKGVRPGDTVVVNLARSDHFIPALWAALISGTCVVPLVQNAAPRLGSVRRREVFGFVASAFERAHLLTDTPGLQAQLGAQMASLSPVLFDDLLAAGSAGEPSDDEGPDDVPRLAILTSGTEGRNKLVALSDRAVLARWWPRVPDGRNDAAFLSWSPFDHVMGLALAAPNLGTKVHLDAERFVASPLAWLDTLEATAATHATMTNFGMSLILDGLEANPGRSWDLSRVRKVGIGTEQISARLCGQFLERLARFGLRRDALILGYGLTECGPVVGGGEPFSPGGREGEPVRLDRPTAGHGVRIVDANGGVLEEGESGTIEVRGPTMTSGYLGVAVGTDAPISADGWLRTGDLGFVQEGVLTVIGRTADQVPINGKKYSCQQVEDAIAARSRFAQIYVAPLAHDPGRAMDEGKPVAVFAVADEPVELAEVAAEIRAAVAATYKFAPAVVGVIAGAEVPRTSLGKVQRHALAALVDNPEHAARLHRLPRNQPVEGRPPAGDVEARIAAIWAKLLRRQHPIGPDDDFFVLGGDSIMALQMCLQLEEVFGCPVPVEQFAERSRLADFVAHVTSHATLAAIPPPTGAALPQITVERMWSFLASWPGSPATEGSFIRRLNERRDGIPLFWCLQTEGEAAKLANASGPYRPVYAMRSANMLVNYGTAQSRALVERYIQEIGAAQPDGPVAIGGNCQGCTIALAVARGLMAAGRTVHLLALADTSFAEVFNGEPFDAPVSLHIGNRSKFNPFRRFRFPAAGLRKLLPAGPRLFLISAAYPIGRSLEEVCADVETAIGWASTVKRRWGAGEGTWHPESIYAGSIKLLSGPLGLHVGEAAGFAVTVKNSSPLPWQPFRTSGIALGNHWLSASGEVVVWADGRTPLRSTIEPGDRQRMRLDVVAPASPADYLLEFDMVEEGVKWFGEKQLHRPLHIEVRVERSARSFLRMLARRLRRAMRGRPAQRIPRMTKS